jgi:uncharacterized membrane protein YjfL (UPF0719 family)
MENTLNNVLVSVVFAVLGFILLFVGYKVFDALTPNDLSQKIFEEGNVACAIFAGAFIIGLALIVAHVVS